MAEVVLAAYVAGRLAVVVELDDLPLELLAELPGVLGVCHSGTSFLLFLSPSSDCPIYCNPSKFSYAPLDPRSDFTPLPASVDLSEVFRTGETRLSRGCTISYKGMVYMMVDADGVVLETPDDTGLDVHVDAITEELYVERSGRHWACVPVARRSGRGPGAAQDRRDLQRLLSEMQRGGAAREG